MSRRKKSMKQRGRVRRFNPETWERLLPPGDVRRAHALHEKMLAAQQEAERSYERGDIVRAESADARADQFAEQLESFLESLEFEEAERADTEQDIYHATPAQKIFGGVIQGAVSWEDPPDINQEFAEIYRNYLQVINGQRGTDRWWSVRPNEARGVLVQSLRDVADSHWEMKFLPETTDDQLVDAARDAHAAFTGRRRRREKISLKKRLMR
jgi:hypothetical protein